MSNKQEKFVEFSAKYEDLEAEKLIEKAVEYFDSGKLASFSSFGAYSALLLDIIARVDKTLPILFLETGKHFYETLQYVDDLEQDLGLENLIKLYPDSKILANADSDGDLWKSNVNRCCWIRKVEPLDRHLEEYDYDALITGRRAYQTAERADMKRIELDDKGHIRINPIAFWSKDKIKEEFASRNLRQHPLVDKGYPSIGCKPCTNQVKPGEDERSGRWSHVMDYSPEKGSKKSECGIHLSKEETSEWVI